MRTKCRSIATFHRPIHSHWSLPLICMVELMLHWAQKNVTGLSLVIAAFLLTPAPCHFFLWLAMCLIMKRRKIQRVGCSNFASSKFLVRSLFKRNLPISHMPDDFQLDSECSFAHDCNLPLGWGLHHHIKCLCHIYTHKFMIFPQNFDIFYHFMLKIP